MGLSVLTVARTVPWTLMGGMEEVVWNLAKALSRLGIRETIVTTSFTSEVQISRRAGVEIHEIPYVPKRLQGKPHHRWWPYFGAAAANYAHEADLSADVLHSHSFYANGFLGPRDHAPIVLTVHGTPMGDYLGGARDKLRKEVGPYHPRLVLQRIAVGLATDRARRQLRRVQAIVAVSRNVAQDLNGLGTTESRVAIIPNGIEPTDFPIIERRKAREALDVPPERTVLSFVGRIEEFKGVGSLLDVLRRLPDAMLLVAGDGPYLPAFRGTLQNHPAGSRVRILGPVRENRHLVYAASDLFCLPSRHEGAPVTLLEAMAMGTPVATTQPWLPEDLLPFASVHPDPVRMVQDGLARAKTGNPEELRTLVRTRYNWDRIAQSYADLFRRLAEAGS